MQKPAVVDGIRPHPFSPPMPYDYEVEKKRQAAANVLDMYSNFVMACLGNQVRPCDMRMHLRKEVSDIPTSLKKNSIPPRGASSISGTAIFDQMDSFQAL